MISWGIALLRIRSGRHSYTERGARSTRIRCGLAALPLQAYVQRSKEFDVSVAFTKEESAETAAETLLPDRLVSPQPNLVTEAGLKALEAQLDQARAACEAAEKIED